jgi:hypothetical protein
MSMASWSHANERPRSDVGRISRREGQRPLAAAIPGKLWYNLAMSDPETKSIFDREPDAAAEAAADAAADAEIEAGQFVSNDRVVAWLKSWGTPNELPCPEPEPR